MAPQQHCGVHMYQGATRPEPSTPPPEKGSLRTLLGSHQASNHIYFKLAHMMKYRIKHIENYNRWPSLQILAVLQSNKLCLVTVMEYSGRKYQGLLNK